MRDIQRRAIDAYLDAKATRTLNDEIMFGLLFTVNDPVLRRWLIAQRKWERNRIAEVE